MVWSIGTASSYVHIAYAVLISRVIGLKLHPQARNFYLCAVKQIVAENLVYTGDKADFYGKYNAAFIKEDINPSPSHF